MKCIITWIKPDGGEPDFYFTDDEDDLAQYIKDRIAEGNKEVKLYREVEYTYTAKVKEVDVSIKWP